MIFQEMSKNIRKAARFIFWTAMAICAVIREASHISGSKRVILLFIAQILIRRLATCQTRAQTEETRQKRTVP